ncbi:MAG: ATP-binding protein, partial [Terracidiphilus sp.]
LRGGGGLDEASRQDLAEVVDEESARLDALIGEAIEMAQLDSDTVQVRLAFEHPRALLEQAVVDRVKALAAHRISIGVQEPESPAWFDPHLLGRVLRHLLENAARFTPPGGRITLRCRRAEDRLEFAVEDDGPGIHPADMPFIFERFYRGKRSKTMSKGTGMGLAIVRSILRAHGGGIEAESEPGQGARFRFWVPLVDKYSPGSREG